MATTTSTERERVVDLIEAALDARFLDDVNIGRDALRPGVLVVTWHDGSEMEVSVRDIPPAVDIDSTVMSQVPVERPPASTEDVSVAIDPEVVQARKEIDAAIPQNRWSYESGPGQEWVVAPDGKRYRVYMGTGRPLARHINESLGLADG